MDAQHTPAGSEGRAPDGSRGDPRVTVVIVVLNGAGRIGRTLTELTRLPERPEIIVVDNASTDGTSDYVRRAFPDVRVVEQPANAGAAGRNIGVAAASSPYVAFAEDDSWYEPGALRLAADLFDAHSTVGLINAHVTVGEDRRPDPLHEDMVDTPVADPDDLPGHRILSFLEGASVVRREAYCGVGGFDPKLLVGGPEEHLAADLLAAGWELRYVPEVRVRHMPEHGSPSSFVRRLGLRNTLWFAWERRPFWPAVRWTLHVLRDSPPDRATVAGLVQALRALPGILRARRPLPPDIERQLALLDEAKRTSQARGYGGRGAVGDGWRQSRSPRVSMVKTGPPERAGRVMVGMVAGSVLRARWPGAAEGDERSG